MLHKVIDFTQTILGTVALTGIIAFSVITVNALNPSIRTSSPDDAKVAGLSTLPRDTNALPIQITDTSKDFNLKGNLYYVSGNKSTFKLEVQDLTQIQELEFINVENLNHFKAGFKISMFMQQNIVEELKVELVDNIDYYELKQSPKAIELNPIEQKALKLKLTPLVNINFPFELDFEITQ
ncbi:MAG: hypothetical protein ABIM99_06520 [Candidatus Dojkabacteria bacterium]